MKKVKYPTIKIFALLSVFGLFAFLNETTILTYPHYAAQAYIPDEPFALIAVLSLFYSFIAFLAIRRKLETKNIVFMLVIAIVGSSMIFAVFSHPANYQFNIVDHDDNLLTLTYAITRSLKLRSLFFVVTSMISSYIIIVIVPQLVISKRVILSVAYLFTFFIVAMCIYSLITETSVYVVFFKTLKFDKNTEIRALFSNKNVFGFYLFLALMYIAYAETISHRVFHYLIMIFLTFFIVMSLSKTVMVSTILFYSLYFLYDLLTVRKNKPKKFALRSILLILSLFTFLVFIGLSNSGFATSFREEIIEYGIMTFQSRTEIWKASMFLLQKERLFIGHGFGTANELLGFVLATLEGVPEATNRFHNTFIAVLATGGLVFLTAYVSFLIFVIYRAIKLWKVNAKYASTVLFMFLAYLLQGMTEAKVLFKADMMGLASTFILVVPVFVNPKFVRRNSPDE